MANVTVRHCIAQKRFHYYRTSINRGQSTFEPGDNVYVDPVDLPRLEMKHFLKPIDKETKEITVENANILDIFPKKSNNIWVFGDGPTAMMCKDSVSKDAIVFGVNRCFFERKQDGSPALALVPDYYTALDDFTMTDLKEKIQTLASCRKFTKRGNSESGKYSWPDLKLFDVPGETGFSTEPLTVYHGKTSVYCAMQLAVQCGLAYYKAKDLEIHFAGIDLAVLTKADGTIESHHYGRASFDQCIFTRMLTSIRYGLNYLNEIGVRWINHSPLLENRIKDLIRK